VARSLLLQFSQEPSIAARLVRWAPIPARNFDVSPPVRASGPAEIGSKMRSSRRCS
jgi:hypothetical protein